MMLPVLRSDFSRRILLLPMSFSLFPRPLAWHIGLVLLATAMCSGCSRVPGIFNVIQPYRIDIQQGNVLNEEMVAQLRPGLTRDQVRFILGTPLLVDAFHAERWDYLFRLQVGQTGHVSERKLSVFFDDNGFLTRATGNVAAYPAGTQPQSASKMQVLDLGTVTPDEPMPPLTDEEGFWSRFLGSFGW
jgi:outer membrane protein assembly factor BamE